LYPFIPVNVPAETVEYSPSANGSLKFLSVVSKAYIWLTNPLGIGDMDLVTLRLSSEAENVMSISSFCEVCPLPGSLVPGDDS
jgi:hypothetical protein